MNTDDYVRVQSVPDLREPVLLAAFAGWNDAAQVATYALTTLLKTWSGQKFADIDPEEFFVFTSTRPTISLDPTGQRSLRWPSNSFFSVAVPEAERDVVLLVGTEPELRWRAFCRGVLQVADQVDASCLVTLGGLMADVPHTVEPRLTGFANVPKLLPQLQSLGVDMSSYEGPTGIVGSLHDAWQSTGRPALSIWGNVPHYISATPNPQVALALLRRVAALLKVEVPLARLETQAASFATQVDEALAENPDALEYVHQLEEHFAEETPPAPAPGLIEELEKFLRTTRPPGEDEDASP